MERFLTYAKFYSDNEAEVLGNFLKENNVIFLIDYEKDLLDKFMLVILLNLWFF